MRRALAALAVAALPAAAQLPGLGADLTVRVVDSADAPVAGAFVIGREFVNVPKLHGSATYCESADLAAGSRMPHEVRLPSARLSHLTPDRTHALEAFAYAPGMCVERTPSARAAAQAWSYPSGTARERRLQSGSDVRLRARRVGANEDRLQYLVAFAEALVCEQWSAPSRAGMAALAQAMQEEAAAIARSRYEDSLARRLDAVLAAAMQPGDGLGAAPRIVSAAEATAPFARDFVIAPATAKVRFPAANEPNQFAVVALQGPVARAAAVPAPSQRSPGMATLGVSPHPAAPVDTRLAVHCRHGPPSACDLDERDAQGHTALYTSVGALDVDAVKLLLDAGANPSIDVNLQGADALDALLSRAMWNPPATGSADADRWAAILELLAASPKASIRASLADQLAADPSQWLAKSPASIALLTAARTRLATLARRPDPARSCEPIEPERVDLRAMPVRLR